jgi:hypothetical protein
LGNTYTTFAMNLKHRGDIAMIQDSLLLNSEQAGYLGRLEVGWSIVRLQGRWFWPFLVKLPLVGFEKGTITDARLSQIMKERKEEFSCLLNRSGSFSSVILAQGEISRPKNAQDKEILALRSKGKIRELKDKKGICAIKLTTQERNFLMDVWHNQTSSVIERYSRLSFSSYFGDKLQNSLLDSDFISYSLVILPRGRIKILKLTEKGKKALGINPGESDRHGGPEHKYWIRRISDHLQANGYGVAEEVPVGEGRAVDLVATRDGEQIALEIETGKSDVIANIKKCLDAGLNKVVVAATSVRVRDRLSGILPKHNSVELITGSELLKRNRL